jgi:hypothetical protein
MEQNIEQKFVDKTEKIIVEKIGLTQSQSDWCKRISDKYAIWIANQIKANPEVYSSNGEEKIRIILGWKKRYANINLNDYTYDKALKLANKANKEAFIKQENSLKNKDIYLDLGDYKWVRMTKLTHLKEEGAAMNNCIGTLRHGHAREIISGRCVAYSLRDLYNRPHITLKINKHNNSITEFRGKCNEFPNSVYVPYLIDFLEYNNEWTDITAEATHKKLLLSDKSVVERLINKFDQKLHLKLQHNIPFSKEDFNVDGNLDLRYIESDKITLPEGTNVKGNLFLHSSIVELPDNLKTFSLIGANNRGILKRIGNNVKIENTITGIILSELEYIGENFEINSFLDLSENKKINKIPNGLKVAKDLYLSNNIIEIGENVEIGTLELSNVNKLSFSKNVKIGRLIISNQEKNIPDVKFNDLYILDSIKFPETFDIEGDLEIRKQPLNYPKKFKAKNIISRSYEFDVSVFLSKIEDVEITGDLDFDISIAKFPKKLTVGGELTVSGSSKVDSLVLPSMNLGSLSTNYWIKKVKISDNSTVGKIDLYDENVELVIGDNVTIISDIKLKSLPKNLTVNGNLDLSDVTLEKYPDDLKVSGNITLSSESLKNIVSTSVVSSLAKMLSNNI